MSDFVQILKILPIQGSPSHYFVGILNFDFGHFRSNFFSFPSSFKVASACFFLNLGLIQFFVAYSNVNLLVLQQPVVPSFEQGITSSSSGLGGFPMSGLFGF